MKTSKELYEASLKEIRKENPDIKMVLENLNKASSLGNVEATYALATWYLHGENVQKDFDKAVSLLKIASSLKHTDALYDLAVCYEEGKGIEEDKYEAFKLYQMAALYGDKQSYYEVGRCLYHGIGISEDKDLAEIWLEKAEELGITD